MKNKSFRVEYKDEGNGVLEGYASTWIRTPDSYGDVVKEGAFKDTLKDRWNGGKGIPLLWAHKMDELAAFIGTADAEEDEKGLHFVASFDNTEEAQRVRDLYKSGRLSRFSFAYDVLDNGTVTLEDGTKANELRKLDLYEISCVLVPANDDAGVVDVKAGRRNSQKDLDTMDAIESNLKDALSNLRSLREVVNDTEEPAKDSEERKANDPAESKEQTEALNARKGALLETIAKIEKEEK